MTPHPYTEDQLVEQPAIGLFAELGWQTVSAMEEEFGPQGTLQRDGKADVVLLSRLIGKLNELNPALPSDAIDHAINELTRDRSSMSVEAANREIYQLLKDGVGVSVPDRENGGQKPERVRVIDWDTPANNDFLLVSQMSIQGDLYNCRPDLRRRLEVLTTTEMAVVVSPSQNEIPHMKALGLDIEPHRRLMNESNPGLDERFKDTADPLRLVFVCAMWLTGFDAPSCSTLYLDKPMRNHSLMQAIARANRVFPGKHSGAIVDYANVFASLEKALAIYGAGKDGHNPVNQKGQLVEDLRRAIDAATVFCAARTVSLDAIEQLPAASLDRLQKIDDGVNALIAPDQVRQDFFAHERLVTTLYRAVKPDPIAIQFAGRVACISAIGDAIRAKLHPNPADISVIMGGITALLDDSITGVTLREHGPAPLDLSKINFKALADRFKKSAHKNTDIETLKAAIRAQLAHLIELNPTRADFAAKFEELIDSYNNGSRNIEQIFDDLLKLSLGLSDEEQRHVRESMSEEELVIFDILTRPAPELSTEERAEVKKIARDLLKKMKALLVINWRQKIQARAKLRDAIESELDAGLPRAYTRDMFSQKCNAVFEHVYDKYPEPGAGVYSVM